MQKSKSAIKKKRKKILLVLDFLEPGGATRINHDLTKIFSNADFYLLSGVNSFGLGIEKEFKCKKKFLYKLSKTQGLLLYTENIFKSFLMVFSAFRQETFDTVILNVPYSSLGVLMNPLVWKCRKIYFFHGVWFLEQDSARDYFHNKNGVRTASRIKIALSRIKSKSEYIVQKTCLALSDKVVVFSNYSNSLLKDTFGIRKEKVVKLLPPVDFGRFLPKKTIDLDLKKRIFGLEKTKIFLVPSRIEPRKGIHLLLEAIKFLKTFRNNIQIICCGPIGDNAYVLELFGKCKDNDLFNLVKFIPTLKREKLFEYYQAVDFVIMPSIDLETLGMITIESLYFGVPVIAYKNGASSEVLGGLNKLFLVDKQDAKDLALRISKLADLSSRDIEKLRNEARIRGITYCNVELFLKEFLKLID